MENKEGVQMSAPPPYAMPLPPTVYVPTVNMSVVPVGPNPTNLICPSCHASVVTRTESKSTTKTHVLAVALCLFLCWPCVCLPYCMDSCMNTDHFCPNCRAYLGTYVR